MGRTLGILLGLTALLLTACGASEAVTFVPVGTAQGQPTFLFLYTDN